MNIEFVSFDEYQSKPRFLRHTSKGQTEILLDLMSLMTELQQAGVTVEYETKVTLKQAEIKEPVPILKSKELFIKMLNEKSDNISEYIKELYDLDEESISNIDGFLSEYKNENESSLDTIKLVRNKVE